MLWLGLDDTDSLRGGCTTYIAARLCEELDIVGYPRLIRLNPNIPYKTRGNAACAICCKTSLLKAELALELVEEFRSPESEPGLVVLEDPSEEVMRALGDLYSKAVSSLVSFHEAQELIRRLGIEEGCLLKGRGLIGALAAIGADLSADRTYELIAYRLPKNYGKQRRIKKESVVRMNELTSPLTFDNLDPESGRVLIAPRGYDPVLCGIRGESPEAVERAFRMLEVEEEVELVQIFETNQATDAHLRRKRIADLKPYDCVIVEGVVLEDPKTIKGGHVVFKLGDPTGEVWCAAYEPTKGFRKAVRALRKGDRVVVHGGLGKRPDTINLEKHEVVELVEEFRVLPPFHCGRRATSLGRGRGYKCKKCGTKLPLTKAELRAVGRELKKGLYEPPPAARRHISKPLLRYRSGG